MFYYRGMLGEHRRKSLDYRFNGNYINVPLSTYAAVKLVALAQSCSSFSWKVSGACSVLLFTGEN